MKLRAILIVLSLAAGTQAAVAQSANCPPPSQIVYIHKVPQLSDPVAQAQAELAAAKSVVDAVAKPNTMVLLAPDVDIDFSGLPEPPPPNPPSEEPLISLARCVTLASYQPPSEINAPLSKRAAGAPTVPGAAAVPRVLGVPPIVGNQPVPGSGRTPQSFGPVLRYGTNSGRNTAAAFIQADCSQGNSEGTRILGFRVFGPDFNDHQTSEIGININGCHDAEIANMEVAGWGGAAVQALDPAQKGIPTQAPFPILVRIHNNYIHHNQHSTDGQSSFGYGVNVGAGAFAEISQSLFDFNKHAITASGDAGGYNALGNLILKGGGFMNAIGERDIHIMDVHGTDNCLWLLPNPGVWGGIGLGALLGGLLGGLVGLFGAGIGGVIGGIILGGAAGGIVAGETQHLFNCGDAGFQFVINENTFQYTKSYDLRIRGTPKGQATIRDNIFARSSQDDAIKLYKPDNVQISSTNQYNDDTFGRYGVCDIDGDGIDDLILMTGVSWWFSSSGQFPWSFLRADPTLLGDVRLGDVDGDGRCDFVKDAGDGSWLVASGGTADWKPFGNFATPLIEVQFGRFDPGMPDFNRGIRAPTHAFRRDSNGAWFVTPLSEPGGWTNVGSSSFPLSSLRFGDFTGDGVTDVLGNEAGHWAISKSARAQWTNLNPTLNDPVQPVFIANNTVSYMFIANMDAGDNVDDVLRLDVPIVGIQGNTTVPATWRRSLNGSAPWSAFKSYGFSIDGDHIEDYVAPGAAFVGQFRGDPGASILTVDANRIGHFFSPAQGREREEWVSLFAY